MFSRDYGMFCEKKKSNRKMQFAETNFGRETTPALCLIVAGYDDNEKKKPMNIQM